MYSPKIEQQIKNGINRITQFYANSNGRPFLWLSSNASTVVGNHIQLSHVLTFETHQVRPGIRTAIALVLPMREYSFDDFLAIVHGIEDHFNFPLLVHAYPRDQVLRMRDYFDQHVREDVVL